MYRKTTIRKSKDLELKLMMSSCNEIERGLRSFKNCIKVRQKWHKKLGQELWDTTVHSTDPGPDDQSTPMDQEQANKLTQDHGILFPLEPQEPPNFDWRP